MTARRGARRYVEIARRYAEGVAGGRIRACRWARLACRRHLDDLDRARMDPSWPYEFNPRPAPRGGAPGPAERVCLFTEALPHIKGEWANRRERIVLSDWQVFVLTTVFGWVHRRGYVDPGTGQDLGGKRRFRSAYIEMGRKNGKSTLSAPIGIYTMCADGEQGAECYSAATKEAQARVAIWDPAKKMVERQPVVCRAFGVDTSAHSIFKESTASFFKPLSSERHSLDALNVHCGIIDELHAHRNRDVYDLLQSARGSRLQPLIWMITTAGSNRSGICYEQREYVTKILGGAIADETYFGIIYTLDDGDDWRDEGNWVKANPNLDVSVYSKELRPEALKAARIAPALGNFLTKHMSVWVSASVNLFNMTEWQALADPRLRPEDFRLDPCWIGLDFAPRNDFTSRVMLFRREEGDETHFYAFARHFLSEGKVEESENSQYAGWAREGWIRTNPGNQTDGRELVADVVGIVRDGYQVQEVDCDPSRMQGIETEIEEQSGALVVEVQQMPSKMCPAQERLSALIADGKIHHDGDPVLAWMLSNVIGRPKGNWGLYPDKERPENKIDGVTALLIALSRAMGNEAEAKPEFQFFSLGG